MHFSFNHARKDAPSYVADAMTAPAICPLCERPFSDNEQAARVHAKHDAQERAVAEKYRRQFDHDRLQLQTLARKAGLAPVMALPKTSPALPTR